MKKINMMLCLSIVLLNLCAQSSFASEAPSGSTNIPCSSDTNPFGQSAILRNTTNHAVFTMPANTLQLIEQNVGNQTISTYSNSNNNSLHNVAEVIIDHAEVERVFRIFLTSIEQSTRNHDIENALHIFIQFFANNNSRWFNIIPLLDLSETFVESDTGIRAAQAPSIEHLRELRLPFAWGITANPYPNSLGARNLPFITFAYTQVPTTESQNSTETIYQTTYYLANHMNLAQTTQLHIHQSCNGYGVVPGGLHIEHDNLEINLRQLAALILRGFLKIRTKTGYVTIKLADFSYKK